MVRRGALSVSPLHASWTISRRSFREDLRTSTATCSRRRFLSGETRSQNAATSTVCLLHVFIRLLSVHSLFGFKCVLVPQASFHLVLASEVFVCRSRIMLRYSPSRIRLTLADLDSFEERFQARQSARLSRPKASNVRLSPGPAHPTRLSFVPANQNVGRQRAASSSSDVVMCDDGNRRAGEAGPTGFDGNVSDLWTTPTDVQQQPLDQSGLRQEAARTLESVADLYHSPTRSYPRRQVDSLYEERREIQEIEREIAEHSPASNLDGIDESVPGSLPPVTPFVARAHEARHGPQTEPRPLSSARARRRHARSSEDPDLHHEGIRPFSTQSQMWLNPVPQLVLPAGPSQASLNPALDPGAPVFVPRTRFGTAIGSSTDAGSSVVHERPWRSLDHTSSSSNLRVRSSDELNIEPTITQRTGPARQSANNEQLHPRLRQRSRTSDQNTAFPLPSPNLERYPLLRPSSSLAAPRRTGTFDRSPTTAFDRPPTSAAFITTEDEAPPSASHQPQHFHVRRVVTPQDHSHLLGASMNLPLGLRSVSPALSASSRSTPNLLNRPLHPAETHSRGSSLSWRRSRHPTPVGVMHRVPSLPATAAGSLSSSPRPCGSRQSSREGLDAAAEFLRMRNSPLDDLTERLSRLAAGRQRSVGRSWERAAPHGKWRVSLLAGDPFRQEIDQDAATSVPSPAMTEAASTAVRNSNQTSSRFLDTDDDPVALSLSLPPSSPVASSSSQALPSTPPAPQLPGISGPRSPLAQRSPAKKVSSPPLSIKRKPVPSSSSVHATPKVKVYDDARPRNTQPQTPADVSHSIRRTKTRSDTAVQQSPLAVGRAAIASPARAPPIPERNPYRNTYPPAPATETPNMTAPTPQTGARRARQLGRALHGDENETENEMEGSLRGLEQDRRIWLARRERGDLDVTPPREGRFERYLS